MPVNINGYALSNASGLKFDASNTKIVTATYGISDPALPGMQGSAMGGSSTYKVYPFPVNSVDFNNGSPWNASAFRFTAPVAGIYYISYGGIVGNGTATQMNGYFAIIINGVNNYWGYKDTISLWELMHTELLFKLAAGDTVAWAMNIAPGPDSGNVSGGYQSNHNVETIWLVG